MPSAPLRSLLMTRVKPRETEIYHGTGASANLILTLKKGAGRYHGVQPSGSKFQAFVYKPDKRRNVAIGTFDTAIEAAVAAALAKKTVKAGIAVYSPEKPRYRKGAARTPAHRPAQRTHLPEGESMPPPGHDIDSRLGRTPYTSLRCCPLLSPFVAPSIIPHAHSHSQLVVRPYTRCADRTCVDPH